MTKTEFFTALREAFLSDHEHHIVMLYGGEIRIRRGMATFLYCPVTFLAWKQCGTVYNTWDTEKAGADLGLLPGSITQLVHAADRPETTSLRNNLERALERRHP